MFQPQRTRQVRLLIDPDMILWIEIFVITVPYFSSVHMCMCMCVDSFHKLLTGVLTTPPPISPCFPFYVIQSICFQLSPFPCLFPTSPPYLLSAIFLLFFFFFKKYVRAQSRRLQAFPHKQPNLSLWFSAYLFWVFLREDISAGKPNGPERVLSLWGSLQL